LTQELGPLEDFGLKRTQGFQPPHQGRDLGTLEKESNHPFQEFSVSNVPIKVGDPILPCIREDQSCKELEKTLWPCKIVIVVLIGVCRQNLNLCQLFGGSLELLDIVRTPNLGDVV
jgi:hypothetical protein